MSEIDVIRARARARKRAQEAQGGVSTNSEAVADFKSKLGSAFDAHVEGGKFGFGDNIAGLRTALMGMPEEGPGVLGDMSGTFGERYAQGRDAERARLDASREANPTHYTIGNLTGTAATALASLPFATGKSALGTAGRGLGIGIAEGGLHGGGAADGQDVGKSVAQGATIGGIAGVAAPMVVGGAGYVKNAVKDPTMGIVDSLLGRANQGKANRAIANTMASSGSSPDDVAARVTAAREAGQPEYRMMDALGVAGQRRASSLTRRGGPSGTELAEFLERRQQGQGERIGSFIEDAYGFRGQGTGQTLPAVPGDQTPPTSSQILSGPQRSAKQTTEALETARRETARVAYDAARGNAAPVDVRGVISTIDERLGPTTGNEFARDGIDARFQHYRDRLIRERPDGSTELSDFNRVLNLKQDIQTEMKDVVGTPAYGELKKIERALDQALEASSPSYRAANDGYRAASDVIDAVGDGAHMASRGRAVDNVPTFQSMTPDQQAASRIGYGDTLLERLGRVTAPTSNRAKALQSPKRTQEAEAMTLDPRLYSERLARENDMWGVQNRALRGSHTADNLFDDEAMESLAGGAMDVGRSAFNFQFGDAIKKIADKLGPIAKGQNEETRQLIARALMSDDPAKVLAPAIAQQTKSAAKRRILEALTRPMMREHVQSLRQ